jgi:Peptidase family M23
MRFFLTAAVALAASLALAGTARAEWVWPLRGEVITPYRNVDDPYAGGQHRGIDIAGPVGARVVAAAGGEVRFAGTAGSSGLTVSVRTTDGFDTSYLHLSSLSVREGELVSSGDAVGAVGTTGSRSAPEPHLHFGVREAGTRHAYRNPLDFLPSPEAPPAPDSPHPAPSPAPAPTPVAPAPAPVGEPGRVPADGRAPRRVPADGREPRRVPADGREPRRVPAPDRAPRRVPVGGRLPRGVPAHKPAPQPTPILEPLPRQVPAGEGDARRRPLGEHGARRAAPDGRATRAVPEPVSLGPTPSRTPAEQPPPHGSPSRGGRPAARTENTAPGPDIGWILACVGLLLAAGLLGLTEDRRSASRKGTSHLARLLRPLTGRG